MSDFLKVHIYAFRLILCSMAIYGWFGFATISKQYEFYFLKESKNDRASLKLSLHLLI